MKGLSEEQIETIRSNEVVRDAFVDCYTLQGIVAQNEMNVTPEQIADWDRLESTLIRAILRLGTSPWDHALQKFVAYVGEGHVEFPHSISELREVIELFECAEEDTQNVR